MVMKEPPEIKRRSLALRIAAKRAGGVDEIVEFLSDLNGAYVACYLFNSRLKSLHRHGYRFDYAGHHWLSLSSSLSTDSREIPPFARLEMSKVSINSPGFWEFIGSLNPVQQLREYLKDRHDRAKDLDYRNSSEKKRLELENSLLEAQLSEAQNRVFRERISLLREIGVDDREIHDLVWRNIGPSLARLGRHQDSGLIGRPIPIDEEQK